MVIIMRITNSAQNRVLTEKIYAKYGLNDEIFYKSYANKIYLEINNLIDTSTRFIFFIGAGNNGKLALEVAKSFATIHNVVIVLINNSNLSAEYYQSKLISIITVHDLNSFTVGSSDVFFDGLFGNGVKLDLPKIYLDVIEYINNFNNLVISLKMPSGLPADITSINPSTKVVIADYTIIIEIANESLFALNAKKIRGEFILIEKFPELTHTIRYRTDLERQPVFRLENEHKYTNGVCVVVGGDTFLGASILALQSAFRTNNQMTVYFGNEHFFNAIIMKQPEIITYNKYLFHNYSLTYPVKSISLGTGSNLSSDFSDIIDSIAQNKNKFPVVLDGVAISKAYIAMTNKKIIITPHHQEFAKLLEISIDKLEKNRVAIAKDFANVHQIILVLKSSQTIVTNGTDVWFNTFGNPQMASPGVGDVLTGMIVASISGTQTDKQLFEEICYQVMYHSRICDELYKDKKFVSATTITRNI